jgi:hypothetical protein
VLFKAHDGNRTDDTLHWENWQMLRGILRRSDFLYVADSKLCVSKTLLNIDRSQGRFITWCHARGASRRFPTQGRGIVRSLGEGMGQALELEVRANGSLRSSNRDSSEARGLSDVLVLIQ